MAVKSLHVRKTFNSVSFIECGLRCEQEDWCVSIGFDFTKQTGICELSDYGLDETRKFLSEMFDERKGFVFSQLREFKGVLTWSLLRNSLLCWDSTSRRHFIRENREILNKFDTKIISDN